MDISFVTKIVCDVCMWFGAAGLVLSLFGASGVGIEVVAVLAAGSAIAAILKKPPLKLLSIAVLLLSALWIRSFLDCLMIVPPCLYCIFVCMTGPNQPEYSQCRKYMTVIAPIALALVVIVSVCGGLAVLGRVFLPYYAVFLIFGVLTLSISRHEEQKRNEKRLLTLVLTSVAACCTAALFFSSSLFFRVAGTALSFVYNNLISPIVMGLVYALTALMWLVASLFNIEALKEQLANKEPVSIMGEMAPEAEELGAIPERPELVGQIAMAIGIIAFIILAIIIFRRLAGRRQDQKNPDDGVRDLRRRLNVNRSANAPAQRFAAGNPRQAVRRYYRKFLSKAQAAGVDIHPASTSASIARLSGSFFEAEQVERLRDVYIVARYSTREITKADVKTVKAICSKLKPKQ